MLLKNISNIEIKNLYGVVVQEGDLDLIEKFKDLQEVSVLFQSDEDGVILDDILDFLIVLKLKSVNTILEIDLNNAEHKTIDTAYIYQLSTNVGFGVSILPDTNDIVGYRETIKKFTKDFLNRPNFEQKIYPISSYMECMVLDEILGEKALSFVPSDEYIIEKFASKMIKSDVDDYKADIRKIFVDHYGSEKNLSIVIRAMVVKILEKSQQMFKEQAHIDAERLISGQTN